jgi:serine/threonine-protein kinase
MGALGVTLMKRGSLDEADRLITESARLQREVFGPDSQKTATAEGALAELREKQGRNKEALEVLRGVLGIAERAGMAPFWKGYYTDALARNYLQIGQLDRAEEATQATLRIYSRTLAPDHLYLASSQELLGEIYIRKGDNLGAEATLREAIAIDEKAGPANRWRVHRAESTLGVALSLMGRFQEAETLLLRSYRGLRTERGESDEWTQLARKRLLEFLHERHRDSEAPRLLAPN